MQKEGCFTTGHTIWWGEVYVSHPRVVALHEFTDPDQQPRPQSTTDSLDPNGQLFMEVIKTGLCKNCTVLTAKTSLTFSDGSPAGPAQGIYIHHVLVDDVSKNRTENISKCGVHDNGTLMVDPNNPYGEGAVRWTLGAEFITQGEDAREDPFYFTSMNGKYNSGFLIGSNDSFSIQADLVNYNTAAKDVYVAFDIEYVDGLHGQDAVSALMAITGCELYGQIKLDPYGPAKTESPKFPILVDGRIVAASEFNNHKLSVAVPMLILSRFRGTYVNTRSCPNTNICF
jgi:hypothetical protein